MAGSPRRDCQACPPCRLLVCATDESNISSMSRLITTYYLLDISANGFVPQTWEPRELWPQRYAYTTFRDALEFERLRFLFPCWRPHRECPCSSDLRSLRSFYALRLPRTPSSRRVDASRVMSMRIPFNTIAATKYPNIIRLVAVVLVLGSSVRITIGYGSCRFYCLFTCALRTTLLDCSAGHLLCGVLERLLGFPRAPELTAVQPVFR